MEIKNHFYFMKNIKQFFRFLKIKFICFFMSEVIIFAACYYYIVIFCIIYANSKVSLLINYIMSLLEGLITSACIIISLLINYIMSLLEGLITSACIIIIIFTTRLIGLKCLNKRFYNISKYVNDRF